VDWELDDGRGALGARRRQMVGAEHRQPRAHVDVQRLDVDTLPRALGGSSQRLGRLLAEQLLEGLVLWQMPEAQRQRLQRAGLGVGPINVTEQGLVVQFTPDAPR
jgi:hypothetical protein